MADPETFDIMGAAEFDALSADERNEYLDRAMAHLRRFFAETTASPGDATRREDDSGLPK